MIVNSTRLHRALNFAGIKMDERFYKISGLFIWIGRFVSKSGKSERERHENSMLPCRDAVEREKGKN